MISVCANKLQSSARRHNGALANSQSRSDVYCIRTGVVVQYWRLHLTEDLGRSEVPLLKDLDADVRRTRVFKRVGAELCTMLKCCCCKSCKWRTNGCGPCQPISIFTSQRLNSPAGNWCEHPGKLPWTGRWSGGLPPSQWGGGLAARVGERLMPLYFHTDHWIRGFGGALRNTRVFRWVYVRRCVSLFTTPRRKEISGCNQLPNTIFLQPIRGLHPAA